MAKVTTQTIPSEQRIIYKRAAQIATTVRNIDYVRTRYPWRIKNSQAGGSAETPLQKTMRDRFRYVVQKYSLISAAERLRWVDANPEYHSFLYGYNFFMLEGLMGGGPEQYPQMIKSIQVVKQSMAAVGNTGFVINTVDPAKVVVLIAGNSFISDLIQSHTGAMNDNAEVTINLSPNVDPTIAEVIVKGGGGRLDTDAGSGTGKWGDIVLSSITASQVKIKLALLNTPETFNYSVQIIEHKAQTVYPVQVSIAAELITMAWAIEPSLAADVTITAVEYL